MLRLFKAYWLGALSSPGFVVDGGFFVAVRAAGGLCRRREVEDDVPLQFLPLFPFLLLLYFLACVRCTFPAIC